MAYSSGVYTLPVNSFANATDGDIINPDDADATHNDFATAYNAISQGTVFATTDVVSAATCNIGAAATGVVRITGSTGPITSLGTTANCRKFVLFASTPTLTHNATSLILPGGVDLTAEAGACAIFVSDASGNWRCFNYMDPTGGVGNVTGPASATDNAAARFNLTTGEVLQNSSLIISDTGDLTAYDATNDGNPVLAYGASATERLTITPTYDSGAQTLDYVKLATDVASATADKGLFRFNVDGTDILDIDDGGINLAASKGISIAGTDILTDAAGTATLRNIDALDTATKDTIEAAIDTLANLVSVQGHTVTLTGALVRSGAHSLTLTTTNTTSLTLPESGTLYASGGTDVALADGGTGASLADPGADRLLFWDDSETSSAWLALGAGLAISTTTLNVTDVGLSAPAAFGAGDKLWVFEGNVLKVIDYTDLPGAGGGLTNIVEDVTPQLGADLDANTFNIGFDDNTGIEDDDGNEQLIFQKTASAVNQFEMTNAATGNPPQLSVAGGDTNIDLLLAGKGTGTPRLAALNGGQLAGFRNALHNGAMMVNQRGGATPSTPFTSATTFVNNDAAILLDRWRLLSDGNDIVDVSQSTEAPTGGLNSIALDVETVDKKFGILQVVEQKNCIGLIGNTVTLSAQLKVTNATRLDKIKMAIIAWDGTADAPTADIISAWGIDGTNPTLVANWTYENTPADLGVTTSWARYSVSAAVDTASTKNIGVFVWSDNVTDTDLADFLHITDVQLEIGPVATPFERRPQAVELNICQRYLPSFIFGAVGNCALGQNLGTTICDVGFIFRVAARAAVTGLTHPGASTFSVMRTDTTQETCSAVAFGAGGADSSRVRFTVAGNLTAGHAGGIQAGAGAYLVWTGAEI